MTSIGSMFEIFSNGDDDNIDLCNWVWQTIQWVLVATPTPHELKVVRDHAKVHNFCEW